MVVPAAGGRCDAACENSLYVTRQIHVAMGKEFNRLRRLYVSTDSVGSTQLAVRAAQRWASCPCRRRVCPISGDRA